MWYYFIIYYHMTQAFVLAGLLLGVYYSAVKDATVSLKMSKAMKAKLISLSKTENRSLSNFIEKVLKEEISRRESSR